MWPAVKTALSTGYFAELAERVRFELTVPVKVQRFSRPSRSTTPAPLRVVARYNIGKPKRKLMWSVRRTGRSELREEAEKALFSVR